MNGNSSNQQLLINLQNGSCTQNEPVAKAIIVNPGNDGGKECCSAPTNAVTIDSNSFGNDDCADIDFTFVNTTQETQTLVFGKRGQAGLYQILGFPADASNVAGVTADAGSGAVPNVGPLQGFNWITQDGIVVTGFEISVLSGGNAQAVQKVILDRQSVNITDKCKRTIVKPSCSECVNENDPQTFFFKFCRMFDAYNSAEYNLIAGASVEVKIHYAGLATAKGIVACAGVNKGMVVTAITQTP